MVTTSTIGSFRLVAALSSTHVVDAPVSMSAKPATGSGGVIPCWSSWETRGSAGLPSGTAVMAFYADGAILGEVASATGSRCKARGPRSSLIKDRRYPTTASPRPDLHAEARRATDGSPRLVNGAAPGRAADPAWVKRHPGRGYVAPKRRSPGISFPRRCGR